MGKKLSEEHKRKISQSHLGVVPNLSLEERQRRSQNFIINNPNNRKVYCLETDKTYISGSIAAKDIGLSCDSKNVSRCCRGEIKSVQGYHFCFAENANNYNWGKLKINHNKKRVYCVETNKTYESAIEAAKNVLNSNDNSGIIRNCQGSQKTCKGFHFKYAV